MKVRIWELKKKIPLKDFPELALKVLADVAITTRHNKDEELFCIGDDEKLAAFLIKGSILLESFDGRIHSIDHKHGMSRYALANIKPRMYSAVSASDETVLFWVKDQLLSKLTSQIIMPQDVINIRGL
ncbi:MAG: hypothetical protein GY814_03815 [Gammaproteobacteria bacterium]|nr:hypothetical protein [Gammaproteobacteria bacterium]